jgi:hypothetical protein
MKTPKEKAKELVDKFYNKQTNINQWGISCMQKEFALIVVDEIIENEKIDNLEDNNLSYWEEVKTEIENL